MGENLGSTVSRSSGSPQQLRQLGDVGRTSEWRGEICICVLGVSAEAVVMADRRARQAPAVPVGSACTTGATATAVGRHGQPCARPVNASSLFVEASAISSSYSITCWLTVFGLMPPIAAEALVASGIGRRR
jgi:hypothetical protein